MSPRVVFILALALAGTHCVLAVRMQKTSNRGVQATQEKATEEAEFRAATSYCYEKSDFADCWSTKPSGAPECVPSSGATICKCPDSASIDCDIDHLSFASPTTGRCAKRLVYVGQGEIHSNSQNEVDVTGKEKETYCLDMRLNDQWKQIGFVAQHEDGPESTYKHEVLCEANYTAMDGACLRNKRFLGESCWGSLGAFAGQCQGASTEPLGEYTTSCYKGTCVPYAFVKAGEECTCSWLGWSLIWACSAADDKCGGHACVTANSGSGRQYCDYGSKQSWNTVNPFDHLPGRWVR